MEFKIKYYEKVLNAAKDEQKCLSETGEARKLFAVNCMTFVLKFPNPAPLAVRKYTGEGISMKAADALCDFESKNSFVVTLDRIVGSQ